MTHKNPENRPIIITRFKILFCYLISRKIFYLKNRKKQKKNLENRKCCVVFFVITGSQYLLLVILSFPNLMGMRGYRENSKKFDQVDQNRRERTQY